MALDTGVSNNDDGTSIFVDMDVYRELVQQFYESSVQRYGADSDQSRILKLHLTAHSTQD